MSRCGYQKFEWFRYWAMMAMPYPQCKHFPLLFREYVCKSIYRKIFPAVLFNSWNQKHSKNMLANVVEHGLHQIYFILDILFSIIISVFKLNLQKKWCILNANIYFQNIVHACLSWILRRKYIELNITYESHLFRFDVAKVMLGCTSNYTKYSCGWKEPSQLLNHISTPSQCDRPAHLIHFLQSRCE